MQSNSLFVLFSLLFLSFHAVPTASQGLVEVDNELLDTLSHSSPLVPLAAVVTYTRMPTQSDLSALLLRGLLYNTYQHLPSVGIWGLPNQIRVCCTSQYFSRKFDLINALQSTFTLAHV